MNKLNEAILNLHHYANTERRDSALLLSLADALYEIKEAITPTNPGGEKMNSIEEQATLAPWHDVVEIVGPAEVGDRDYIGFEGVVIEAAHGYKVHMAELEDCAWFPASSLRMVYRLKPRAQEPQSMSVDPPTPRFTFGQRVRHYETTGLFIRYIRSQVGITKEQCQFLGLTDNNIHTCYAEELCLLDELPF